MRRQREQILINIATKNLTTMRVFSGKTQHKHIQCESMIDKNSVIDFVKKIMLKRVHERGERTLKMERNFQRKKKKFPIAFLRIVANSKQISLLKF